MLRKDLQAILDETRQLTELFTAAGKRIYLVGGIVRDLLDGRSVDDADIDMTTDALPSETKAIVGACADSVSTQGERFGTIACRVRKRQVEISTHRAEAYDHCSRRPEVAFGTNIEVDLSRRDFTVNAVAMELGKEWPRLIDPFDGAADLEAKRLRTPRPARESFADDPLRMMRAGRFIASYRLKPAPELLAAVQEMRDRLSIVSVERIRDELEKLIAVEDPTQGLWFLYDTRLSDQFLPEFAALRFERDPKHRRKDALSHTIAVVRRARPTRRIVRLAALFHDIGKPATRSAGLGRISFHGHDVVGEKLTRERMRSLKFSNDDVESVAKLVRMHMRTCDYRNGWTDSAVRRLVRDAGPLLGELIELMRCDCNARRGGRRRLDLVLDEIEDRITNLRKRERLENIRRELDGRMVMEHLGIEPGPLVGRAMRYLLELRLDLGMLGSEEAYRRLDVWWEKNRPSRSLGRAAAASGCGITR